MIWRMAEICGFKMLSYCLMGKLIHPLAEVPHRQTLLQRFENSDGETGPGVCGLYLRGAAEAVQSEAQTRGQRMAESNVPFYSAQAAAYQAIGMRWS